MRSFPDDSLASRCKLLYLRHFREIWRSKHLYVKSQNLRVYRTCQADCQGKSLWKFQVICYFVISWESEVSLRILNNLVPEEILSLLFYHKNIDGQQKFFPLSKHDIFDVLFYSSHVRISRSLWQPGLSTWGFTFHGGFYFKLRPLQRLSTIIF